MKTIEERAKEYAPDPFLAALERKAYIAGATEQKTIDIDIASIILCRYGCPHKIDSNKCLNSKCKELEIFRKMIEEYTC